MSPEKPNINNLENQKHFIANNQFDAFYKGVSLIPQHGDGIRLYLIISTVLEDPNVNWNLFAGNDLSPTQINFLVKTMDAQHEHKNIDPNFLKEKLKRVDDLFVIYRERMLKVLIRFLYNSSDEDLPLNIQALSVWELAKLITDYFKNPLNIKDIEEIKKILLVIKESFAKKEVQDILREYREGFKDKEKQQKERWLEGYRQRLIEILKRDISESFNERLPSRFQYLFPQFD